MDKTKKTRVVIEKATYRNIEYVEKVRCPNCQHNIPNFCKHRKMPYCCFCGQYLAWGEYQEGYREFSDGVILRW